MSNISRIALALLFVACLTSLAGAQGRRYTLPPKDTSTFLFFNEATAGPYFTAGVSRQNENLPMDWHSAGRFAYAFGATIEGSISKMFGLNFSLLYDARDTYLGNTGDKDNIDLAVGYIALQPSIRIFWLLLGLSFDLPMSGNATENVSNYQHPDQPIHDYSSNMNVETSDLATLTEARAVLSIPVLKTESGEVHAIVSGSYPLSKFVTSTKSIDTTGHFTGSYAPGQGALPTVQAGLTFQFDILH